MSADVEQQLTATMRRLGRSVTRLGGFFGPPPYDGLPSTAALLWPTATLFPHSSAPPYAAVSPADAAVWAAVEDGRVFGRLLDTCVAASGGAGPASRDWLPDFTAAAGWTAQRKRRRSPSPGEGSVRSCTGADTESDADNGPASSSDAAEEAVEAAAGGAVSAPSGRAARAASWRRKAAQPAVKTAERGIVGAALADWRAEQAAVDGPGQQEAADARRRQASQFLEDHAFNDRVDSSQMRHVRAAERRAQEQRARQAETPQIDP